MDETSRKLTINIRESRLCSLPPELPNTIYREVLLVDGDIEISDSSRPSQPALLQTNRQTRSEAILIYYSNSFRFSLYAFDAAPYITWCASSEQRRYARCRWSLDGPRNWMNLQCWLETYHRRECFGVGLSAQNMAQSKTGRVIVVRKFFQLVSVKHQQGSPWEEISKELEIVHEIICAVDPRWRLEKDLK